MSKKYYEILGISSTASQDEIRTAYKRAAKKYHPDANPENQEAVENFKLANEAYHILSDPKQKALIDHQLMTQDLKFKNADNFYSFRNQTSYDFTQHYHFEKTKSETKHNKEWSGILFFLTLGLIITTGLVLYFFG